MSEKIRAYQESRHSQFTLDHVACACSYNNMNCTREHFYAGLLMPPTSRRRRLGANTRLGVGGESEGVAGERGEAAAETMRARSDNRPRGAQWVELIYRS